MMLIPKMNELLLPSLELANPLPYLFFRGLVKSLLLTVYGPRIEHLFERRMII